MKSGLFPLMAVALTLSWVPAAAETIRVGGTGSGLGLMRNLGAAFAKTSPGDTVEIIPSLGSAGGIAAAHAGALSLAISVRAFNEKESALGLIALPFLETPFLFATGTTAPVALRRSDILRIYNGEMTQWADGEPIRLILRPRSDAQAMMLAQLLPGMKEALEKARQRPELPVAANDHDNLDAATNRKGSLTAFPLVQLKSEPNTLKPVRLDGVEPTLAAMQSGAYTLTAHFNLVFKPEPTGATKRFLDFLKTSEARTMIENAGAVDLLAPMNR